MRHTRRPNRFIFVVYALPVALLAGTTLRADDAPKESASTEEYEVRIHRKLEVGTKYHITCDGALIRQVTLSAGGQTQKQPDDGFGVHLEGTVEVLALDGIGEEAPPP